MDIQQATDTTVYIIKDDEQIVESSMYDLIMLSLDYTTTPMGGAPRYHKREADDGSFEVWTWGAQGNRAKRVTAGLSEDEADEELFSFAEIDFDNDCHKPSWFWTREEADAFLAECAE